MIYINYIQQLMDSKKTFGKYRKKSNLPSGLTSRLEPRKKKTQL